MAPKFVKKDVLLCDMIGGCVYAGRVKVGRNGEHVGACMANRDKYRESPPCPSWSNKRSWKDMIQVHVRKRER